MNSGLQGPFSSISPNYLYLHLEVSLMPGLGTQYVPAYVFIQSFHYALEVEIPRALPASCCYISTYLRNHLQTFFLLLSLKAFLSEIVRCPWERRLKATFHFFIVGIHCLKLHTHFYPGLLCLKGLADAFDDFPFKLTVLNVN